MVASFGQDAPGIDTRLIRKTRPIPLTSSLGCGTPMSRSDWSAVPVVRFFSVANIESRLIRRRMLRKKKGSTNHGAGNWTRVSSVRHIVKAFESQIEDANRLLRLVQRVSKLIILLYFTRTSSIDRLRGSGIVKATSNKLYIRKKKKVKDVIRRHD